MNNLKQLGWLASGAPYCCGARWDCAVGRYPQTQPGALGGARERPWARPVSRVHQDIPEQQAIRVRPGTMGQSHGNNGTGAQMQDHTFMMKAAEGGMAEVQMGQLAQQNGQSQAVKDFGKRMVTDHTKANDQLKQVAEQGCDAADVAEFARPGRIQQMSKLQGEAFDKAYAKMMVSDHKKDIAEFQREASSGSNAAGEGLRQPDAANVAGPSEDGRADEQSASRSRKGSNGAGKGSRHVESPNAAKGSADWGTRKSHPAKRRRSGAPGVYS